MMSQKSKPVIKATDYVPKRFGLKFGTPPTIVLEYLVPSTGKLFHHKMKLRHVEATSDIPTVVSELMKKHEIYLKSSRISQAQVTELVKKLITKLKKEAGEGTVKKVTEVDKENGSSGSTHKPPSSVNSTKDKVDYNNLDLNKLEDTALDAHKKKMDEVFYKHYQDPKSKEFVYELEKDFENDERVDDSWDQ